MTKPKKKRARHYGDELTVKHHAQVVAFIYNRHAIGKRTFDQIVLDLAEPKSVGGLATTMSRSNVYRLYREEANERAKYRGNVEENRAARIDELDNLIQLANAAASVIDHETSELLTGQLGRPTTILRKPADRMAALNLAARYSERRDKLLGLDAPIEANVTVTHFDNKDLELVKMLDDLADEELVDGDH